MRTAWTVAAVAVILACARPVSAGVYCTDKDAPDKRFVPTVGPKVGAGGVEPMSYRTPFLPTLTDMVDIRNPAKKNNKLREAFEERAHQLRRKVRENAATLEDQINLSAYLIWLAEYQQAIDLLKPIADDERTERHQRNFMLFANLGTAYQISGQLTEAFYALQKVRRYLPKPGGTWPGLTTEQLDWYREAEKYQMDLLKLRIKEANRPAGDRARPPEDVDDLFGVKFVGDTGEFEAGKVAAAQAEKLPRDAAAVVEQLLLWLPEASPLYDVRLFWLLGEVFNAQGNVADAYNILDRCVWDRNYNVAELRAHRQVLQDALPKPESWVPDRQKLLLVGGITGAAVLFFVFLQLRENRRRRQAAAPSPPTHLGRP